MEKHPEIKAADGPIAQYASLLRIRKRWATIGIVALGIVALVSLVAGVGLLWTMRDKPLSSTSVLLEIVLCANPLVVLASQTGEYRRLSGLLELLDVLERQASSRTLQGQ